jgi:hypothetical protein
MSSALNNILLTEGVGFPVGRLVVGLDVGNNFGFYVTNKVGRFSALEKRLGRGEFMMKLIYYQSSVGKNLRSD